MLHIETVRDGEGHARRMQYDRDGHMRNMQDEDGYLTFYGYDKNGKLRVIHYQGGSEIIFNTTPELEAHIKNIDPSVPRKAKEMVLERNMEPVRCQMIWTNSIKRMVKRWME